MERIELVTPGEILLTEFLEPNNITQTKLAGDLDISQSRITEIVNGQRAITTDTAMRLAVYFKTTINFWLNLQNNYDIEKAERSGEFDIINSRVRPNPNIAAYETLEI
jgi:addiction module HigA family antidote